VKLTRDIGDYGWRVFHHVDFICGGVAAVVYFFVADHIGLADYKAQVVASIAAIAYVVSAYAVYREERIMRSKLEKDVRLTARLGSYAGNVPDPGPGRQSLKVHVYWEIWVARDISTEKLGLNVIYQYDKPWWQLWRKTRFPKTGRPPKGKETTSYQKKILAGDVLRDDAEFEYEADCPPRNESPHWLLELVLVVGMPAGEYRAPVAFPFDDLLARGTHPPL
jgi:hypothetical protein